MAQQFSFSHADLQFRKDKILEIENKMRDLAHQRDQLVLELGALENAMAILQGDHLQPRSPRPAITTISAAKEAAPTPTPVHGQLRKVVVETYPILPAKFTIRDVMAVLEFKFPRADQSSVSGYLKEDLEKGILTLIEKGKGRRATIYSVKK